MNIKNKVSSQVNFPAKNKNSVILINTKLNAIQTAIADAMGICFMATAKK